MILARVEFKKMRFFSAGFLLVFCFMSAAIAQTFNTVDRIVETSVVSENAIEAKSKLNELAMQKASEDVIKEIIGDEKYRRNQTVIREKIIKNAAKFIPFSKNGEPERVANGFKMSTNLKINLQDLKAMLLEYGLFYESDSTPMVLPIVRIIDRVNFRSYNWWLNQDPSDRPFLISVSRTMEKALRDSFIRNNFYILKPVSGGYRDFFGDKYGAEKLRASAAGEMATELNAQMYIDGDLVISKSNERSEAFVIELKMSAIQVLNGRIIAEVVRKVETDSGAFENVVAKKIKETLDTAASDLSGQVLDAWQKGALGSSLYRLTMEGEISIKSQENFKQMIKSMVLEIKTIRERLIEEDKIVFEVDSNITPSEIGKKAPEISLGGTVFRLESANESELIYKLKK